MKIQFVLVEPRVPEVAFPGADDINLLHTISSLIDEKFKQINI